MGLVLLVLSACQHKEEPIVIKSNQGESAQKEEQEEMVALHLSDQKFKSLEIKVDTIPHKKLWSTVEVTGELEVPPQHEATITAIMGANIESIKVIEGDHVKKGQVLAYLQHPNLIHLQSEYLQAYQQSQYLEKENKRQKKLYEEQVGSGKDYQKTEAQYASEKGKAESFALQLRQLGLPIENIREGQFFDKVPVHSPIAGYVEKVMVNTGQYVDPQKSLFQVVNNDHVHADFRVFEKDVNAVKKGQDISFQVQSLPGKTLHARIYSVGRTFEKNPKAVHIHAEIENKDGYLIPGMYVYGSVQTSSRLVKAVPHNAVVEENGKNYIFSVQKRQEKGETKWRVKPHAVKLGKEDEGWVEISPQDSLPPNTLIAMNKAYYLISEMKKGATEHHH